MPFTPEQIASLEAKLDGSFVKKRKQGSAQVSYIEGWRAIAEANRIFGHDGWARETVESVCVYGGTYQKPVWENGRKTDKTAEMFRCSYRAKVRVTVAGVVREGTGHGHGFAENPGEAHESAEKEAETDAMKRALMTFGNPFGLALYDKEQENVEHGTPATHDAPSARNGERPTASANPPAPPADDLKAQAEGLVKALKAAKDIGKLNQAMDDGRELLKQVPQTTYDYIGNLYQKRLTAMETPS